MTQRRPPPAVLRARRVWPSGITPDAELRRCDTRRVPASTAARTPSTDAAATAWRPVLLLGSGVLLLSVLLLLGLRTSTNPAPGSFPHDALTWVQEVATLVGSVLVAVGLALRVVARR